MRTTQKPAAEATQRDGPDPVGRLLGARGRGLPRRPHRGNDSVGKARPLVSELVELRRDLVLTLDSTIDDPVEAHIGDRLIARGELQEIGDDFSAASGAPYSDLA